MPKPSSPATGTPELRACTECRKRKTKCSGTSPCLYCSRNKKACIFGRPPSRTPLTRKNLDEVECRCASLVALFHQLNPDVNIEEALKSVSRRSEEDVENSPERGGNADIEKESPPPTDRFDWNESSFASPSSMWSDYPDGMASLPTRNGDSGYLGNTAGSNLLRAISNLLPEYSGAETTRKVQPSLAHPSSARIFQISADLNDTAVLERLVDAYFTCYNSSYPIIHEATFRKRCQSGQDIHARSNWQLIFYLVLAIGDWILDGESNAEQSRYYTAARSRMLMQMLESGNLLNVQAFLLMGNYLQKRDRPNTGYNFIGIAYRMALGLGLHREPSAATNNETSLNQRRRVLWWIVYCFDSGFSLTTGRPIMASDSFIETRLPRNIEDLECSLDSSLPEPTGKPTTYSAIIAQARLASIGNMVYSDVICAANEKPFNLSISRSLDHQLQAWKLSLPVYFTAQSIPNWFRGPRAIVKWKEQNLRMLLWWGSQRLCKLPFDSHEALIMCHNAALETIQSITIFCLDHPDTLHTGLSWYATYFLFQATIVLSIHYLRPCQHIDASLTATNHELWLSSISSARDCLSRLTQSNKAATRCLEVLDRIKDRSQPPQPWSTPTDPKMDSHPDTTQLQTSMPENADMNSTAFAIDPALQIFFQGSSWDNDIFEGLQGFPGTDEVESFDYIPANGLGQGMFSGSSLEPT